MAETVKAAVSGWLAKKSVQFFFASWKKSWYVLDEETQCMTEYATPNATSPVKEIAVRDISRVVKKGKNRFDIVLNNGTTISFKAYGEKERAQWVGSFANMMLGIDRADPNDQPTLKRNQSSRSHPQTKAAQKQKQQQQQLDGREESSDDTARDPQYLPQGAPDGAAPRVDLMSEIKDRGMQRVSSKFANNAGDRVSKRDAVLMDNTVFMGKARGFAVSANKAFVASAKAKGMSFTSPKTALINEGDEEGDELGQKDKRQAVIPKNLQEEDIPKEKYEKTDEQKEKLGKAMEDLLGDFMGGKFFKEVPSSEFVDTMFRVDFTKGEHAVKQGAPTQRMYVIEKGRFGIYTQDFADRPPELVEERGPGRLFGELSLLYDQPGPFTVTALEDSEAWALSRKHFQDITTQRTKKRAGQKLRLLEGVSLISQNLNKADIVDLADATTTASYKDGDIIVKAGQVLSDLFIIGEGTVIMQAEGASVGELGKGEAFGEWALLDLNAKADVSLIAKGPCSVATLNIVEAEELIGPLRDYVTRRWAQERGEQFFFSNSLRGGTLFDPESDVRNPVSQAPSSVAFSSKTDHGKDDKSKAGKKKASGAGAASVTASGTGGAGAGAGASGSGSGAKQDVTGITSARTTGVADAKPAMSSDDAEKLVKQEIEQAKHRTTVAAKKRSTAAAAKVKQDEEDEAAEKREAATTETELPPPPPPEADEGAGAGAGAGAGGEEQEPPGPPSTPKRGADEVDSDSEAEEEDNMDMAFTLAKPLRPELTLDAITPCALLGRGNFGRVHLCRNEKQHDEIFALKVLARHFIVENGWEVLVENERNAMLELSSLTESPFLLKLYHSYSDAKNIYLLLEICEGGDLYNLLRLTKGNKINDDVAKFYMGCVVAGLEAMHSRTIIYRDLKPENLMLDKHGYIKIADFGLAKKTLRTYTVCGTPDYMAPEVILSRGHAAAVDWWALGILLYEMVGASTPFFGKEAMDIYENILDHMDDEDLHWPKGAVFSEPAKSIIKKFLQPKKTRRLGIVYPGVKGVKQHEYFKGFDWDSLYSLKMRAPIKPQAVDMKKYTKGDAPKSYDSKIYNTPDDNSGWTLAF